MKNTVALSLLLASTLASIGAQAKHYSYPDQITPHYMSFGVEYLDMSVDRFSVNGSSPSIVLGYGYRFNRYLELGMDLSARTSGDVTATFVDSYALPDHSGADPILAEPLTTTYENSLKNSFFAGIHLKLTYPIMDNIDLYMTAGATYGRIEHNSYFNKANGSVDHPNNARDTSEYLSGIAAGQNECYLTGVESVCGTPMQHYTEKFDSISPSYGGGLRWMWKDSGSVHVININARSLIDKDAFKVTSYGINYEYQF
jgi:opacity protein-like surface antigen